MATAMTQAGRSLARETGSINASRFESSKPWSVMTRTAPLTIKQPVAPRKPPMTG